MSDRYVFALLRDADKPPLFSLRAAPFPDDWQAIRDAVEAGVPEELIAWRAIRAVRNMREAEG